MKPSRYTRRSEGVGGFRASDPKNVWSFHGANAFAKAKRPYPGKPNLMFPDVRSTDPDYTTFKHTLARDLTRAYPANIDADGFADESGVTGDFSALLTASGLKMTPANAPPIDRTLMLHEAGIRSDFASAQHRADAAAMHRLMFGKRVRGANMQFSRISSTSNPFFEYDVTFKKEMLIHALSNAEHVLRLVAKRDFHALRRDFGWVFASTLVERHQAEGGTGLLEGKFVPKPRKVASSEYALSGGRSGQVIVADKLGPVAEAGGDPTRSVAMRVRTAYGYGAGPTYFLTCALAGVRAQYYDRMAFTWHHTGREQIHDKIKDARAVVGVDVTTMDQFYPSFLLDFHAERMKDYFDPRIGELIQLVNYSPYFAPSLGDGLAPFWAGDPTQPDAHRIDVGLSSGRADNPDLGKYYMTWVYFEIIAGLDPSVRSFRGDLEASMLAFLQGEHPHWGLLDQADDGVFVVKRTEDEAGDRERVRALQELLASGKASPYAVIKPEIGIAFLGNVFKRDELGNIAVPTPSPITMVTNLFCAEHGIDSAHRRMWGLGVLARHDHYLNAGPIAHDIEERVRFLWDQCFRGRAEHPMAAADRHAAKFRPFFEMVQTEADLQVLLDPSKRYYRYADSDLSPQVLDLLTAGVDGAFIETTIGRYLPGSFHEPTH